MKSLKPASHTSLSLEEASNSEGWMLHFCKVTLIWSDNMTTRLSLPSTTISALAYVHQRMLTDFISTENRLQALYDHLQVLASDCSGVPSRHVRASLNNRQSSLPAFSCSWWLTSPGNQNCYFWARNFASSAPKLWNSLQLPLRDSTLTLRQFSSRLKTHLFSLTYGRASWLLRL